MQFILTLQMVKEMMEEKGNRIFSVTQVLHKYEINLKDHAEKKSV
jgi:hypothetical protein